MFIAFYCLFAVIVLASNPTTDFIQNICAYGCMQISATFILFFALFPVLMYIVCFKLHVTGNSYMC